MDTRATDSHGQIETKGKYVHDSYLHIQNQEETCKPEECDCMHDYMQDDCCVELIKRIRILSVITARPMEFRGYF